MNMSLYNILLHPTAFQKAEIYHTLLQANPGAAGSHLTRVLSGANRARMTTSEFIEQLLRTKRPQIFAESSVDGDGSDWTPGELSILGDISFAVPATVFDDGRHSNPKVHPVPFDATLLYVPGALLRNGRGKTPADWDEVTINGHINPEAYYSLYERRLLPGFLYADELAKSNGRQAFVTIPGLGCGQFAGQFRGQLGEELRKTLIRFIEKHVDHLPHIRAVYYDPYSECQNERVEIDHISLLVRPLTKGNTGKSQLCQPQAYEDEGDDFSTCELFSFVAWDHVSWPGNDFYIGSRTTDDGVKAAATSSMFAMTGIEGQYNPKTNLYDPPGEYRNWNDLVWQNDLHIRVADNLIVLPDHQSITPD